MIGALTLDTMPPGLSAQRVDAPGARGTKDGQGCAEDGVYVGCSGGGTIAPNREPLGGVGGDMLDSRFTTHKQRAGLRRRLGGECGRPWRPRFSERGGPGSFFQIENPGGGVCGVICLTSASRFFGEGEELEIPQNRWESRERSRIPDRKSGVCSLGYDF